MGLEEAVKGMLDARAKLRSKQGVADPNFISEQMQRLAQYTGAVEEHLAQYEMNLEVQEQAEFIKQMLNTGMTVNKAQTLAKQEVGSLKGKIAKLKRYVNSSWSLISTAQSRHNHLSAEYKQGGRIT